MTPKRDNTFHHGWVTEAVKQAGTDSRVDFIHAVFGRLEKGAAEYGEDTFLVRPLCELIDEGGEEAADIPGWFVLAAQVARHDDSLSLAARELIDNHLREAAAKAAEIWEIVESAREILAQEPDRTGEPLPW